VVSLVEKFEAFNSFLLFAITAVPARGNNVFNEVKVNTGAFMEIRAGFHKFSISTFLVHLVEAKVLQNVDKVVN